MSKTMKKIGTIFAAATMVGATLTGAIAADLKDLPAPFVKDGKADVTIVVGASAATADVLGSIDIASALQAASVTTTTVSVGGSKTQTASAGAKVESSGNGLSLGASLYSLDAQFDDKDLDLLASGVVTDESSNDDFDYDQTLQLGHDVKVRFDADDTDMKEPALYLDLDTTLDTLFNYTLDFKGQNIDLTELTDSETVTMLGKTFTFDPGITATSDITLYGSDKTEYMALNEPKTYTVDGKTYTVEITGGSDTNSNVVVSVNGVSKTVSEHETKTINGLEIYAKDVFVTNIPTLSAAATLFVGSQKIVLQRAAASPSGQEVEIAGDTINGLTAYAYGANNTAVDKIVFEFQPSALSGDVTGFDETNYLTEGQSVVDPMFGTLKVSFAGGNYALDDSDKAMFSLKNSGKEVELSAETNTGDVIKFSPFKIATGTGNTSNLTTTYMVDAKGYNGTVTSGVRISKNQIFLVQDTASEPKTYAFEVVGFATDNGVNSTRLKDLGTGKTEKYGPGDKLIDGTNIVLVNDLDDDKFTLDANTVSAIYLNGGKQKVQLDTTSGVATEAVKTFTLQEADADVAALNLLNFSARVDTSDNDVELYWNDSASASAATSIFGDTSDDSNTQFGLTQYGTYVVVDVDNRDSVDVYSPADKDGEVQYGVFFAPTDATVSTTGSSSVTTTKVNPIAVGTAVLDSSVTLASESKNLIVVGGPCANSVAAALLKSDKANCVAGFTPGKAVVQLFDTPMGKTAMLVAGYEAIETQAASRAVALMDKRLVGKSVTLTVTSTSDFDISASK